MTDVINVGTTDNDGTGDTLRAAFTQINERFNTIAGALTGGDAWASGVTYTATPVRNWVIESGNAYVCAVNHVSGATFAGDLSGGKWLAVDTAQLIADLASSSGAGMVGFSPTGNIASTTVQTAIAEVNTELETSISAVSTNLAASSGSSLVGYMPSTGSATTVQTHLRKFDSIYPGARKSLADVIATAHAGGSITIACYGDSLTYGQDTSANGQSTQINSSSITRSRYPYPETLADALALNTFTVAPTVYNRGYPGDTAAMGYSRWSSASSTDVAILMFGTNDGKVLGVTIATFRENMVLWIERELGKGAVVILMTPPLVNEFITENNISAYRATVAKLAEEYDLLCINTEEQLSGLSTMWAETSDLVHLSSYAYAELGWQLSTLFVSRDVAANAISSNSTYWPADAVGYGGSLLIHSSGKSGAFIQLTTNQRYIICGYFEDDVLPMIHSYNTNASNVTIAIQYGGNGTYRGLVAPELVHVAAVATRQSVAGPILRKGYRSLMILNSGAQNAYIEGIEFSDPKTPAISQGILKKSQALSGVFQSARLTSAIGTFWTAVDYSNPLTSPYTFTASVNIVDLAGLAVLSKRAGASMLQDFLYVFRVGNDLYVRDFIGSTPTTYTAASAFSSGAFNGEISIELIGTQLQVYLDGVLKITVATVTNVSGYPALVGYSTATNFKCYGAMVQGAIKTPYAISP
jgi:lysophospholipase L1-like esterase